MGHLTNSKRQILDFLKVLVDLKWLFAKGHICQVKKEF